MCADSGNAVALVMIPRLQFDIGWRDLKFALGACCRAADATEAADALERSQSSAGLALVCLSVRSGFDALLQALALPPGSEVVMTSITIPHMVELVETHGLRVVPVAVDPVSLSVAPEALERAVGPATRLIVVSHLLGSRMPMAPIAAIADRYGIPVVEDCAQAFQGDGYRGDAASAAAMFSFGPIKTATALGGALVYCRDARLAGRIRQVLRTYQPLSRGWYLQRVLRFSLAKCLSLRPVFTVFVQTCRLLGVSYDEWLREWVRGFRGNALLASIRRAPPAALIAVLARRLSQEPFTSVRARQSQGEHLARLLSSVDRPGRCAQAHSYWVFPILVQDPDAQAQALAGLGFDATPAASSLSQILPSDEGSRCRLQPLTGWLYLPQPGSMRARERERLAAALMKARWRTAR